MILKLNKIDIFHILSKDTFEDIMDMLYLNKSNTYVFNISYLYCIYDNKNLNKKMITIILKTIIKNKQIKTSNIENIKYYEQNINKICDYLELINNILDKPLNIFKVILSHFRSIDDTKHYMLSHDYYYKRYNNIYDNNLYLDKELFIQSIPYVINNCKDKNIINVYPYLYKYESQLNIIKDIYYNVNIDKYLLGDILYVVTALNRFPYYQKPSHIITLIQNIDLRFKTDLLYCGVNLINIIKLININIYNILNKKEIDIYDINDLIINKIDINIVDNDVFILGNKYKIKRGNRYV